MRFPVACLSSAALAALALGAPAHAQAAQIPPAAKISDIQVSREGAKVSILVKLTQQPSSASTISAGSALVLEMDGLQLAPLAMTPPAGSLVTSVSAGANRLTLSGAALASATTVVYRNAVLIEAQLAEPAEHGGASLLAAAIPAPATPAAPSPPSGHASPQMVAPPSRPATALAPPPARTTPTALPTSPAPHPDARAALVPPAAIPAALTPPTPSAPIALASPLSKPAQARNDLESHAAAKPASPAGLPTASIAGIDAARCAAAAGELAKDAWALGAMGDQALCLLDAGKFDEAKNRLDQLAAITPQDWRVALGLAALHDHKGEGDLAKASWLSALERAPTDAIRAAIKARAPVDADAQAKS